MGHYMNLVNSFERYLSSSRFIMIILSFLLKNHLKILKYYRIFFRVNHQVIPNNIFFLYTKDQIVWKQKKKKKEKLKFVFINSTCHCKQKVAHLDVLRKTHSYFLINIHMVVLTKLFINFLNRYQINNTDMHIKLNIS